MKLHFPSFFLFNTSHFLFADWIPYLKHIIRFSGNFSFDIFQNKKKKRNKFVWRKLFVLCFSAFRYWFWFQLPFSELNLANVIMSPAMHSNSILFVFLLTIPCMLLLFFHVFLSDLIHCVDFIPFIFRSLLCISFYSLFMIWEKYNEYMWTLNTHGNVF